MNVNETSVSDSNKILKRFDSDYVARMRQVFEERAVRDQISRDNYFFKQGYEKGFERGFKKGLKQGAIKARVKNAIGCMKNGMALEVLSRCLELSREELLELAAQNNITLSKSQLGNINE